ncbi:hypothetical protein B0T18DRAFT_220134 [Schizothecium vesticola]|uniref:Uncharacterized protein n=1 Tax=Schizothecium vesticola TaxID=314040 RepID=A0AA40JZS5_9PEZI|nr:hypothetical protein B0T18DRAFT_220134 [Schizothecium vesticola]
MCPTSAFHQDGIYKGGKRALCCSENYKSNLAMFMASLPRQPRIGTDAAAVRGRSAAPVDRADRMDSHSTSPAPMRLTESRDCVARETSFPAQKCPRVTRHHTRRSRAFVTPATAPKVLSARHPHVKGMQTWPHLSTARRTASKEGWPDFRNGGEACCTSKSFLGHETDKWQRPAEDCSWDITEAPRCLAVSASCLVSCLLARWEPPGCLLAFGMRQGRTYLEAWNGDRLQSARARSDQTTDGTGPKASMSSRQRP